MSSELQNIPPLWTAVFHWLAVLLYISLLPKKRTVPQMVLISAVFLAVMVPYSVLIAPIDGTLFNLGMALFAGLTFLPFLLLTSGGLTNHVYYCARAFILAGFTVSLAWQLYSYYSRSIDLFAHPIAEAIFMLVLAAAIYAIMFGLEEIHRKEMQELAVSQGACVGATVIAVINYILSSLSYTAIDSPFTTNIEAEAFNIRTLVYLGGVAMLYAYHLQLCNAYTRQELRSLESVLEMQYFNYQRSQDSIDMVNRKYHDLKHQITVLRSEIEEAQKLECLDQIEHEIRLYETQNQTGNKVLDAIVTSKSAYCLEHGIVFTCVADGAALDFLSLEEVSALFGNAMDNAIEAVWRLEDPDQRIINLSVSQKKGFLRIRVENRCIPDLVVKKGLPATSKEDTGLHGYGLKSIKATAEKYGGSVTCSAEDGWFTLGILIPRPAAAAVQQASTT